MSTNGKTLKFRAAKLKGFTQYSFCVTTSVISSLGLPLKNNKFLLGQSRPLAVRQTRLDRGNYRTGESDIFH